MQITKFEVWAHTHNFVNPVVEDERKVYGKTSLRTRATGKTIWTFVSPKGRIVLVTCNKVGEILNVSGEEVYDDENEYTY